MTSPPLSSPLHELNLRQPAAVEGPRRSIALLTLTALWLAIFFAALFAPPLLDDADATHANAARHMVTSGDMVTLTVNGIRYLEKAPLPYWLDALSFRVFGFNTFAAHLPQAIGVLLLALLGHHWSRRAWGDRAGFYAGLGILTSAGIFLFTRIFIPEVLLSLFLSVSLYCLLCVLESGVAGPKRYAYTMWAALALAVLTKGLVALVFFFGAAIVYLALSGDYRRWRELKPFSGLLLFLVIAAPWHILAGLRNTGGMNGHGFFWFYFVNEHFLRFLGKRYPKDYNKLPGYLFWSLHMVWLFPWSLFAPVAVIPWWKTRGRDRAAGSFADATARLFIIFAALVLVFFSLSTNQEYYTFPAYLSLLALIAAALASAEGRFDEDRTSRRWMTAAHAIYTVIGVAAAAALAYGLWSSRNLPFVPDIGELLAHRGVGDYTLSMSHFFDLTGPSFAALRLPASLAAIAFAFGPAIAWRLRIQRKHLASTTTIALTSAVFLVAAHVALIRFAPMLSSANFATKIQQLEDDGSVSRSSEVLLYGDQSYGSSIAFYLGRVVYLVDGRSTSMLFGSTFPDAPHIFLTPDDLANNWGTGERKILFVPLEKRNDVDRLLGSRKILIKETSGKALFTDRPLDR